MYRRFFLSAMAVAALALAPLLTGCATQSAAPATTVSFYRPAEVGPFNVLVMPGEDPARSMNVVYHILNEDAVPTASYDTVSRGGDPAAYAHKAAGESRTIPNLPDGRSIHGVALTGLEPDTTYYFVAGDPATGVTEEFSFRTFPADAPYSFAIGGDMGPTPLARKLVVETAKTDPDVFIIGGDIAYANGNFANTKKWDDFLDILCEDLRAPDGRLIPLWAGIGNHEVNRDVGEHTDVHALVSPFFIGYFWPQGEGPIFARTLGDDAVLLFMDTGHLVPHEEQVPWLEEQLAATADMPYAFAIYHVPLYPTHRPFEGAASVAGRTHWLPLFDKYKLTAGFEHHDHVFKRTHPMVNGVPTEGGTVYLGDGNMGVKPRAAVRHDYHVRADVTPHFWLIEIGADQTKATAIDDEGRRFDHTYLAPRSAAK